MTVSQAIAAVCMDAHNTACLVCGCYSACTLDSRLWEERFLAQFDVLTTTGVINCAGDGISEERMLGLRRRIASSVAFDVMCNPQYTCWVFCSFRVWARLQPPTLPVRRV